MKKLLMIGLMMIISGTAYSGAKEYTIRICKNVTNHSNCNDTCKVVGKINFKISKPQYSVMKNMIFDTGQIESVVEGNCKIFDDDFECKSVSSSSSPLGEMTITNRYVVSNGKWIQTSTGDLGLSHITTLATCGEEIK